MSAIARVEDEWHGDVPVAAVHGELDASNARELAERVRSLLTNEMTAMVVDLSATSYLDSAGINQLFALGEEMRARQQRLALVVSQGSPIERMLTIIGLSRAELVCPTVPAALERLGR
jgi:anti-anti-sigma factor